MTFRDYDVNRDLSAVKRIWKECGWVDSEEHAAAIEDFLVVGDTIVATIDDEAECCVHGAFNELARDPRAQGNE